MLSPLSRQAPIEGILFDMDGTLVASEYDWPGIRRRLGVDGGSIIDDLNALAEPERSRKWRFLENVEAEATAKAGLRPGVEELIGGLASSPVGTALVTNNNTANVDSLLRRFDLTFDVVVTRDSGLWKPSGAPLVEAAGRLGVPLDRCLAVGDSAYDLRAARDAGCGATCILFDDAGKYTDQCDFSLADVPALAAYLDEVLA